MDQLIELFKRQTIKAKASFMLFFAEYHIGKLQKDKDVYDALNNAIIDGWNWLKNEDISYKEYYDKHIVMLVNYIARYINNEEYELHNIFIVELKAIYFLCAMIGVKQEEKGITTGFHCDVVELEDDENLLTLFVNLTTEFAKNKGEILQLIKIVLEKIDSDFASNKVEELDKKYFAQFDPV